MYMYDSRCNAYLDYVYYLMLAQSAVSHVQHDVLTLSGLKRFCGYLMVFSTVKDEWTRLG